MHSHLIDAIDCASLFDGGAIAGPPCEPHDAGLNPERHSPWDCMGSMLLGIHVVTAPIHLGPQILGACRGHRVGMP